jgi:hypothetical protein
LQGGYLHAASLLFGGGGLKTGAILKHRNRAPWCALEG